MPKTNIGTPGLPSDHWVTAMGMVLDVDPPVVRGRAPILSSMAPAGADEPRLGIFATMVDLVGGYVPDGPRTPTIDLRVQLVATPPTHGEVLMTGRAKKIGNRLVVSETTVCDPAGDVFAVGITTFMNQPFDLDEAGREPRDTAMVDSFEELVAARTVDATTLEVEPTMKLSNGLHGTVQGGAQAFLAELAAEHVLAPMTARAVDLDIRYLNRLKIGPLRARAVVVGRTGPLSTVRVELCDAGNDDRIVSYASLLCVTS